MPLDRDLWGHTTIDPKDLMLVPSATDVGFVDVDQPMLGNGPTTTPGSTAASGSAQSAAATPPAPVRYACSDPGCAMSFGRRPDLNRHMRQHDPHAKRYSCPFEYCNRKGHNGFRRADKLNDHRRARNH